MRDQKLTIDQLLALLGTAAQRIAAVTDGLERAQLHVAPSESEWSANDVLAHLRACGDVWGGSIVTMIREDHPTLRAISPRAWIHDTDYPGLAFRPSLEAYSQQRAELVALLKRLSPEEWDRGGTFTGAGRLLERTVLSEATAIAVHERSHIKQIERVANDVRAGTQ